MDLARLFDDCTDAPYGFPHPRWAEITDRIGDAFQDEGRADDANEEILDQWIRGVADAMQSPAIVIDSDRFVLVTSEEKSSANDLLVFFEHAIRSVVQHLPGIVDEESLPRLVVFLFQNVDEYYSYIEHFYPDGEFPTSGGVFLSREIPHFVLPRHELIEVQRTAAHEITHFCLSTLPIPLWLDEGLATTMQAVIMREPAMSLDAFAMQRHHDCWNAKTIQKFWSGDAWNDVEIVDLAYELARMTVRTLGHDQSAFTQFVRNANFEDGGQCALQGAYGRGLEGLIEQFFGPGDWMPSPEGHESSEPW